MLAPDTPLLCPRELLALAGDCFTLGNLLAGRSFENFAA